MDARPGRRPFDIVSNRTRIARTSDLDPVKAWVANRIQRALLPPRRRPAQLPRPAEAARTETEVIGGLVTQVRVTQADGRVRTFLVKLHEEREQ